MSCIYAKYGIVYLNIYIRSTMGAALSSVLRVKTLVDLINERETVPLLTWFSPTALLPLIQLLQSRRLRGLIYTYAKQQAPWHRKNQLSLQKEEKKLVISDSKATRSSQAKKIGSAMAFCTHLQVRFSILVKKRCRKACEGQIMLCYCTLRCLNGLTVWWYECAIEVIRSPFSAIVLFYCIHTMIAEFNNRYLADSYERESYTHKASPA